MSSTTTIFHPSGIHVVTTTQKPNETIEDYLDRHAMAVIDRIAELG